MIRGIVEDVAHHLPLPAIAGRFHSTLVEIVGAICCRLREKTGISKVVLSGGVFMNAIFAEGVEKNLKKKEFCPFRQTRVPCNDGGLSLGQLAIAAKTIKSDTPR